MHYMTVYRYVRTGKLPATWVAGSWQVHKEDLNALRSPSPRQRPSRRPLGAARGPAAQLLEGLQARLLAGDEPGAWGLLEAVLGNSMTPAEALLDVLGPVLGAIGDGWAQGRLSVADEHRASAVCNRLISRLGARFYRRGVRRGQVLVASPALEQHSLPVAMAANLLRWEGFDVVELGAGTPAEPLALAAQALPGIVAVALGCTAAQALAGTKKTVRELKTVTPVPVVVGGAAIVDGAHAARLGADFYSGRRGDALVGVIKRLAARNG